MRYYQFQVDGRSFGSPLRENWEEAAADAVNKGYGVWINFDKVKLDEQAKIELIDVE